jgi:hypothetical protein
VTVRAALRGGLTALMLVAVALAGGGAGCGADDEVTFIPVSEATHVTGTLVSKDDQRPVDGPMWLIVRLEGTREERVMIPSLFKPEPPTTAELAIQHQVDQLEVGDRLTATGTRNAEGILVAERIEIVKP